MKTLHRIDPGLEGREQGLRRESAAFAWGRLKEGLAVAAVLAGAGCSTATVRNVPATPTVSVGERTALAECVAVARNVTNNVVFVSAEGITASRGGLEGIPPTTRFTATQVWVTTQQEGEAPLAQFEAANGRLNLRYNWLMFQDVQSSTGALLLNPRYEDPSQPRYIGMLLRGATTTDGNTGDYVVRVRHTELPSRGPEWSPAIERDGRVSPDNVLFQMGTNTWLPVRDSRMVTNLQSVAFERTSPMLTVVEYGPTTPVVLATISEKTACAASPEAATRSQLGSRE